MRIDLFSVETSCHLLVCLALCGAGSQNGFVGASYTNDLQQRLDTVGLLETLPLYSDRSEVSMTHLDKMLVSLTHENIYEQRRRRHPSRHRRDDPTPPKTVMTSLSTTLPLTTPLPSTGPFTNQPGVPGSLTDVITTPGALPMSLIVTALSTLLVASSSTNGPSNGPVVVPSSSLIPTTTTTSRLTNTTTSTITRLLTTTTTRSGSNNTVTSQFLNTTTLQFTSGTTSSPSGLESTSESMQSTGSGNDYVGYEQTSLGLSVEAIIGIVIGASVYILLMAVLCRVIVYCSRRRVGAVSSLPVFPDTPYDDLDTRSDRYTQHSSQLSVHYIKEDDNNDDDHRHIIVNTPSPVGTTTRHQHHNQHFQQRQYPWQRDDYVFTY